RRREPLARRRGPAHRLRRRRRGPHAEALPAARHGSRDQDPQAHLSSFDRAGAQGVAMGQKVHPESMRVGYIHDWKSNWFNERHFADYLAEDVAIRRHIIGKLAHAGLSKITIRKDANEVEVNIHTARPGIVIGKSGSEVDALRRDLHRMTQKMNKGEIMPEGYTGTDLTELDAPPPPGGRDDRDGGRGRGRNDREGGGRGRGGGRGGRGGGPGGPGGPGGRGGGPGGRGGGGGGG